VWRAAFRFFPRVPHRLERFGSSWFPVGTTDSQGQPTTTYGGSGPRRPAQVDWWCSRWAVKQGESPGLVEGPRSPGRGPIAFSMAKPAKRFAALLDSSGLRGSPGLGRAQRGPLLRPGAVAKRGLPPPLPALHQPVPASIQLLATSKPARNHFRLPCHGSSNPWPWSLVDEERARRLWHRPSGPKKAAPLWDGIRNYQCA